MSPASCNALAFAVSGFAHEPVQDGCLGKQLPPRPPLSAEIVVRLLFQQTAYVPHGRAKIARRACQTVKSGLHRVRFYRDDYRSGLCHADAPFFVILLTLFQNIPMFFPSGVE